LRKIQKDSEKDSFVVLFSFIVDLGFIVLVHTYLRSGDGRIKGSGRRGDGVEHSDIK